MYYVGLVTVDWIKKEKKIYVYLILYYILIYIILIYTQLIYYSNIYNIYKSKNKKN